MSDPFVVGAIRRILKQRKGAAPGPCPDANELSAWMESRLNPKEIARFEDHASSCANCQQALALFLQLTEPEPAAARAMVDPRTFSYRSSSIRMAFAAVVVVVAGVLLFQATRQSTVVQKMPEVAHNQAPAVISGGPAAVMRSPGAGGDAMLAANAEAPAASAPRPAIQEKAKADPAGLASQRPQAPISTEIAKKTATGELADLAMQKNRAADAMATPPNPANEAKPVQFAANPPAANQIALPLSMSNSASNSAMNVQNLPTQQATGQTAQVQAATRGVQAIGAQQAAVQQTQQANVQQATAAQQANISQQAIGSQQANVMRQADAHQPRRMAQDMAAAEVKPGRATDTSAPKVSQALDEVRLLLAKDGKKTGSKKIGSRSFYRTANFWVDSESIAHAGAATREMARDSKEFKDLLAKEKKLSNLKDAPILLYWNAANCLIR